MSFAQTKTIKVSDITHKHLLRLGRKGETFERILARLIQEHLAYAIIPDLQRINELCGDALISAKSDEDSAIRMMEFDEVVSKTLEIFDVINFDFGIYPDWEIRDCLEMAMDEDMVGAGASFGDRDLPLSEVVANCYCLYLEMESPTTGLGALISPLSLH